MSLSRCICIFSEHLSRWLVITKCLKFALNQILWLLRSKNIFDWMLVDTMVIPFSFQSDLYLWVKSLFASGEITLEMYELFCSFYLVLLDYIDSKAVLLNMKYDKTVCLWTRNSLFFFATVVVKVCFFILTVVFVR